MFTRTPADCPPELRGLTGPVLGYVGTIWPDLDLSPALRAARAIPDAFFLFLGRRRDNPAADALERLPNVRFLGARRPVEVPDYLARFDVCLDFLRLDNLKNDILSPGSMSIWLPASPLSPSCPPTRWSPFPTWSTPPTRTRSSPGCAAGPWRRPAAGPGSADGNTPGRPPGLSGPGR